LACVHLYRHANSGVFGLTPIQSLINYSQYYAVTNSLLVSNALASAIQVVSRQVVWRANRRYRALQHAGADQHNDAPSHVDLRQRIKIAIAGATVEVLKGAAEIA
jgi:hypothetical protein